MTETAAVHGMRGIPWRLENGGCAALPLPRDETIAPVARSQVTSLLPALGLAPQDVDDVALMVSELATNVLQHATCDDGLPGAELWVYQRADGQGHDELVVKAFDTMREWLGRPDEPAEVLVEHGRGLEIIDILTKGRWGHHPSRSRLGAPPVRGKATWFALPIARTRIARVRRHGPVADGGQAMRVLRALLVQRGLDDLTLREELGVCVMSGHGDLAVWCDDATFRWHTRRDGTGELPVTDITEACERLVQICESMADLHVV